jgi:DNA-binding PadR family transcriptional regulator
MHATTFPIGAPWLHGDRCRGAAAMWLAAMTGRRGRGESLPGFGPWAFFGGHAPWGPPTFGGQRGPRARRGDIRAAVLAVLSERPMNGYQIIQEIAERSQGVWKPSPGSIYPTLQQLEDEGLVRAEEENGRRVFHLTDEGEAYVAAHPDEVSAPWEAMAAAPDDDEHDLRPLIGQAAAALWQILATGSADQQARAHEVLADTRRRLYGILAEGDDDIDSGDRS